ncbi:cell wall hydrolase [Bacillus sp. JJ1532]|uniref:cell wall hydrolase n=1 Tax=Bacillus sp. JJ1532 TaxID=3122958 RepID=UPI002FFE27B7
MIKTLKKTILTGAAAATILGTAFTTISGVVAAAPSRYTQNQEVKVNNHKYTHLERYSYSQIKQYEFRFKQLGYNIHDQHSIMNFQRHYHLHADGILGRATIEKLMRVTYNQYEVDLLARAIYMQAYNQPFNAQIGVGSIILNRLHHSQYPNSIYGVIQNDSQFRPVIYGRYADIKLDAKYYRAAYKAIQGIDPTRNELYVQNKLNIKATSSISLSETGKITYGQNVFTR